MLSSILCRNYCYFCGEALRGDRVLCESCLVKTKAVGGAVKCCPRCSFPLSAQEAGCASCHVVPENMDSLLALSYFKGVHKECLSLYKSGKMKSLRYFYASWLHERFQESEGYRDALIVPVPPRKGKIRRKGWDQVRLLSATLNRQYGYRVADILKRTDSIQQKSLNLEERQHHLQSRIILKEGRRSTLSPGRSVILLDDVFTSGATLSVCASVLKGRYSNVIRGAVLCAVL